MNVQQEPIIISNWFQYLAGVIMLCLTSAVSYLFHSKADKDTVSEMHEDIREIRKYLMGDKD